MNDMEVRELISATRRLADELEARLGPGFSSQVAARMKYIPFEGETTLSPGPEDPEARLKWLVLAGGIYAIQRRQQRPANKDEQRSLARDAGYHGAQALNGWIKGFDDGRHGLDRTAEGVWVTKVGFAWIESDLAWLRERGLGNLALPVDLSDWVAPSWDREKA